VDLPAHGLGDTVRIYRSVNDRAGVARLADAIAKHYGLPPGDLLARLQKGRFRVKANTDRTTADQYCRDLERLGARVVVEEATPANSQRSTPLPFPAVRPATPPAGTPAVRPATPPAGTPQYQSGLAAAFSGETPAASLGALEADGAAFSVASLDGAEEKAPAAAASFAPPGESMSASIGPPPEKPKSKDKAAKADKPKDVEGIEGLVGRDDERDDVARAHERVVMGDIGLDRRGDRHPTARSL